ncbi:unnamed protein product [Effrenium voratum]|uniref:Acyltransferase n=1 Tax=Effrenium voratum TaxID=2562239 RepID=A0AA36IQW3_9DINO|nr:unnamed protein product [Effrenium voratum]
MAALQPRSWLHLPWDPELAKDAQSCLRLAWDARSCPGTPEPPAPWDTLSWLRLPRAGARSPRQAQPAHGFPGQLPAPGKSEARRMPASSGGPSSGESQLWGLRVRLGRSCPCDPRRPWDPVSWLRLRSAKPDWELALPWGPQSWPPWDLVSWLRLALRQDAGPPELAAPLAPPAPQRRGLRLAWTPKTPAPLPWDPGAGCARHLGPPEPAVGWGAGSGCLAWDPKTPGAAWDLGDVCVLSSKKGFIKYCLQFGYRAHPVYTFGECETYHTFRGFKRLRMKVAKNNVPALAFFGWPCLPFLPRPQSKILTYARNPSFDSTDRVRPFLLFLFGFL